MAEHWLQSEIARRQIEYGRDESLQALFAAMLAWHAGQGTRGATCIAVRQTYVGQLLGEGFREDEAAERLKIPLRTLQRDVATLRAVYEPIHRGAEKAA